MATVKVPRRLNHSLNVTAHSGHSATRHSHNSHYIDITELKHRHISARTAAMELAGQTTEAIIMGTLCAVGMLILGLPYAPMIGALVGVTACIPIVGAYAGAFIGAFMILTVNPFQAIIFLIFLPAVWELAAITVGGICAVKRGDSYKGIRQTNRDTCHIRIK